MEFTITCPVDGPVDVGLEDIDTVVLRDSDRADITFACPHCGSEITVAAIVPSFLLAAIQALADEGEASELGDLVVLQSDSSERTLGHDQPDPARIDAYCEYFRRQLTEIEGAEDAVAEIDASARS